MYVCMYVIRTHSAYVCMYVCMYVCNSMYGVATTGEQIPGEDSTIVHTHSMVALNYFRNRQPGRSQHRYSHVGLGGHTAAVESSLTVDSFGKATPEEA